MKALLAAFFACAILLPQTGQTQSKKPMPVINGITVVYHPYDLGCGVRYGAPGQLAEPALAYFNALGDELSSRLERCVALTPATILVIQSADQKSLDIKMAIKSQGMVLKLIDSVKIDGRGIIAAKKTADAIAYQLAASRLMAQKF